MQTREITVALDGGEKGAYLAISDGRQYPSLPPIRRRIEPPAGEKP